MAVAMPELAGVRHRDVDAGGVRLHVAEAGPGDGEPVLLVHGWPQHWWCWREVVGRLPGEWRLIMPDLRGMGWSEKPEDGYEKEQLASDLIALLDALGLERVRYLGHDWGAFSGLLLALRAPERVSALLILSVPHLWPSRHDQRNPWRLAALAYQGALSTPGVGEALMRRGLAKRMLAAGASQDTFSPADLDRYDAVMRTPDAARSTSALYRTFLLREVPPIVRGRYAEARLEVPARLIVGERDVIVRGADLDGHGRNAPELTVERAPGARHFLPEERPQLVADRARALFGA
jgi:pimeloyl-ACP methyl ester carboxylesterase